MKERLEVLLYEKLDWELTEFKKKTLEKEKDEIYGMAYEIDSVINLYEQLVDKQNFTEEKLEALLVVPNLLIYLYDEWLSYEDYRRHDFHVYLAEEMEKMQENRRKEQEARSA